MRRLFLSAGILFGLSFALPAFAAPSTITYMYDHHIFSVSALSHPEWWHITKQWYFQGMEAEPPARMKTCGKDDVLEPGWTYKEVRTFDEAAIAETIRKSIASKLDRNPGSVTIDRSASGSIVFDGLGLPGRHVNIELTARMTREALERNVAFVTLPIEETPPQITVNDPELREKGIKEVVTVGESVFAGSPVNRRHNIAVGLAKFNGHVIPKDSIFSFDEVLGPVNATTGYRKELVIQGDTTLPDFGGGLCQVSSTAYRGPWEYGLPIIQRKNHSYAVSYYSPQGTDATVYPPNIDMKFKNDTPGDLLIQTHSDSTDHAYFIYYGTKDERASDVFGPYIYAYKFAPKEERILYTTEIPPGEKRKAGERHDGMRAVWYRTVTENGETQTQEFFSAYEARPFTWQIGVRPEDIANPTGGADSEIPSWLPKS